MAIDGAHITRAETPNGNTAGWAVDYDSDQRLVAIESEVGSVLLTIDEDASPYDVARLLDDVENELDIALGGALR